MDPQRVLAVRKLYAQLPTINCQRRCAHSCTTKIDMSVAERDRIEAATGHRLPDWMRTTVGQPCPLLTLDGTCSVYGLRPLVCRLWGVVDNPTMTCEHGCDISGTPLTDIDAVTLIINSMELGGEPSGREDVNMARVALAIPGVAPLLSRFLAGDRTVTGEILKLIHNSHHS